MSSLNLSIVRYGEQLIANGAPRVGSICSVIIRLLCLYELLLLLCELGVEEFISLSFSVAVREREQESEGERDSRADFGVKKLGCFPR